MATAILHLYTDFVCPFCFIAEQSTVPRLLEEFDLQLDWCGFELHPGTPPGGRPLSHLFPGVDLDALHAQTQRFAASFGVTGFSPPNRLQNSRRALALAEVAREQGRLEPFRNAAFEAHWRRGEDLEDTATLQRLATMAGLDPDAGLSEADSPGILQRVDARQQEARRRGVTGIPTFVISSQRIVGCQPYSALATAAARAGVTRRSAQ
ncbi:MAG TPA: DsbA family protein [Polyangiaceae bacterium]|nr:DsbA family protein [Polyangiaceae bacterium]